MKLMHAAFQKLLRGNNIFTLNFTPTTKKGHNLAKLLLWWLPISNLTYILQWYILLQTSKEITALLQKLLSRNQYQHNNKYKI